MDSAARPEDPARRTRPDAAAPGPASDAPLSTGAGTASAARADAASGPAADPNPDAAGLRRVLGAMRVGLHVLFALLLAVGFARAWLQAGGHGDPQVVESQALWPHGGFLSGPPAVRVVLVVLTAALAGCYLAGTTWDHRLALGRTDRRPGPLRVWWLIAVLGLWTALVCVSPEFVWLLFPLVFVIVYVLGDGPAGLSVTAAAAVVAIAVPAAGLSALGTAGGWGFGGVLGPLVGVACAVGVARAYRLLRREAERQRAVARHLAETQARALAAEREAGRLAERAAMAREIHDTLAQGFNSLVLFSRAAGRAVDGGDTQQAREQIGLMQEVAEENLAQARALVTGDAPAELTARIGQLAEKTTRRFGLPVTVVVEGGDAKRVPGPVAEVLERVCREALTNTVRHAAARSARVTLSVWPEAASVDVHDDGRGFDPQAVPAGHVGLAGLRARVAEAGGELHVDSSAAGTLVSAQVPLTAGRRQ